MRMWRMWIGVLGVLLVAMGGFFLVRSVFAEPDSAEELFATARALESQGAHQEAMGELDKLILRYPGSDLADDALFIKGEILLSIRLGVEKEGNKAEASRLNNQALPNYKAILENYHTGNVVDDAIRKLAAIYQEEGRVEEGLSYVRSFIAAHPENQAAKKARWEVIRRGQRMASIRTINALVEACEETGALEADPRELARVELSLARSLKTLNPVRGVQLLTKVVDGTSAFPDIQATARLELGKVYLASRNESYLKLGVKLFEEILTSLPESPEAREARAGLAVHYASEDLDRAFSLFREAFGERAENLDAASQLGGLVQQALGDRAQNLRLREALVALASEFAGSKLGKEAGRWIEILPDPMDPAVLPNVPVDLLVPLHWAYGRLKDDAKIEAIADELLRRGDRQLYMHGVVVKSGCYKMRGETEKALALCNEALARYPKEPFAVDVMWSKIGCHEALGDFQGAIATADAIIENYHEILLETAKALWAKAEIHEKKLGDIPAARTAYQAIADGYPGTYLASWAATRLKELGRP